MPGRITGMKSIKIRFLFSDNMLDRIFRIRKETGLNIIIGGEGFFSKVKIIFAWFWVYKK